MLKLERNSMKKMTARAYAKTAIKLLIAIKRVADDGMSEMRCVHAYLMHSPCSDRKLNEREPPSATKRAPPRKRPVTTLFYDSHTLRIPRLAADKIVQLSFKRIRRPVQNSDICLFDPVVGFERLSQGQISALRFRDDNDAARFDIEPMDNPGTGIASDS